MNINQLLQIISQLIKDWRFIVTIIAMIFVIVITNKIVFYKKRPKRPKRNKKGAKTPPAPKPVEKPEPESEEVEN